MTIATLDQKYRSKLVNYAAASVATRETAEDLVADVFAKLAETNVSKLANPKAWLYKALRNKIIDHYRSYKKNNQIHVESMTDIDEVVENNERDAISASLVEEVKAAMEKLDEPTQEVVSLKTWQEMTFKDIAITLSMNESTVKKKYYEAIARITEEVGSVDSGSKPKQISTAIAAVFSAGMLASIPSASGWGLAIFGSTISVKAIAAAIGIATVATVGGGAAAVNLTNSQPVQTPPEIAIQPETGNYKLLYQLQLPNKQGLFAATGNNLETATKLEKASGSTYYQNVIKTNSNNYVGLRKSNGIFSKKKVVNLEVFHIVGQDVNKTLSFEVSAPRNTILSVEVDSMIVESDTETSLYYTKLYRQQGKLPSDQSYRWELFRVDLNSENKSAQLLFSYNAEEPEVPILPWGIEVKSDSQEILWYSLANNTKVYSLKSTNWKTGETKTLMEVSREFSIFQYKFSTDYKSIYSPKGSTLTRFNLDSNQSETVFDTLEDASLPNDGMWTIKSILLSPNNPNLVYMSLTELDSTRNLPHMHPVVSMVAKYNLSTKEFETLIETGDFISATLDSISPDESMLYLREDRPGKKDIHYIYDMRTGKLTNMLKEISANSHQFKALGWVDFSE